MHALDPSNGGESLVNQVLKVEAREGCHRLNVDKSSEQLPSTGSALLVSDRQLRLLEAATEQESVHPGDWAACFGSRLLAQLSLPHSDPGNVPEWVRTNNALTLTLTPGNVTERGERQRRYPYGVVPRYLLTWITTEAVVTKSRHLDLGDSLASFLRAIGLNTSGAAGQRAKTQLQRLAVASLNIEDRRELPDGRTHVRGENFNVASSYDLWFGVSDPEQPALLPSTITLSERFFEETMRAPVKLDPKVLKVLAGSSMRIDLYTWLMYRTRALKRPSTVRWDQLQEQFGANYKELRQFKHAFLRNLREVQYFFPASTFAVLPVGIKLNATKTLTLRSKRVS